MTHEQRAGFLRSVVGLIPGWWVATGSCGGHEARGTRPETPVFEGVIGRVCFTGVLMDPGRVKLPAQLVCGTLPSAEIVICITNDVVVSYHMMYHLSMRRITINIDPEVSEWLDYRASVAEGVPSHMKELFSHSRIINRALKRVAFYATYRMRELHFEGSTTPEMLEPFKQALYRNPYILELPFLGGMSSANWPAAYEKEQGQTAADLWDSLSIPDRWYLIEYVLQQMATEQYRIEGTGEEGDETTEQGAD